MSFIFFENDLNYVIIDIISDTLIHGDKLNANTKSIY